MIEFNRGRNRTIAYVVLSLLRARSKHAKERERERERERESRGNSQWKRVRYVDELRDFLRGFRAAGGNYSVGFFFTTERINFNYEHLGGPRSDKRVIKYRDKIAGRVLRIIRPRIRILSLYFYIYFVITARSRLTPNFASIRQRWNYIGYFLAAFRYAAWLRFAIPFGFVRAAWSGPSLFPLVFKINVVVLLPIITFTNEKAYLHRFVILFRRNGEWTQPGWKIRRENGFVG